MDLKYFLNAKNYLKVFYKPGKIIPVLRTYLYAYYDGKYDVKFKDVPDKDIISIYKNSLHALGRITNKMTESSLQVQSIEDVFGPDLEQAEECVELKKLFTTYGSDKATTHDYYLIYYALLKGKRKEPLKLLEIGLGTNNIDVLSNMGRYGKPGASLRGFRDYLEKANIYGADVDKRVLFEEERIDTFFIDQTDLQVLESVKKNFGNNRFDLIIDDGLHNSEANLNTLDFALDLLSNKGIFVIEDVNVADFEYYKIVFNSLKGQYKMSFVKTKAACVFLVTHLV